MKTIINSLIAVWILSATMLFAGGADPNFSSGLPLSTGGNAFKLNNTEMVISKLAPVTPREADFEESVVMLQVTIRQLSPVTPKETDFEDADAIVTVASLQLAPVTPPEADFIK
jgi:hypothetical protein